MTKKTTKNTVKRDCMIVIVALIVIMIGAIKSISALELKSFLIFYAITIIGLIVFNNAKESLKVQFGKRDRLD